MPHLNKVMVMGHVTRDPEFRTFANGGAVCKFGLAVESSRKRDAATGKWSSEVSFLDVAIFDRGDRKQATNASNNLGKGTAVFVEGKLVQDSWQAQDGTKRSKIVINADNYQIVGDRGPKRQEQPAQVQESGEENPW